MFSISCEATRDKFLSLSQLSRSWQIDGGKLWKCAEMLFSNPFRENSSDGCFEWRLRILIRVLSTWIEFPCSWKIKSINRDNFSTQLKLISKEKSLSKDFFERLSNSIQLSCHIKEATSMVEIAISKRADSSLVMAFNSEICTISRNKTCQRQIGSRNHLGRHKTWTKSFLWVHLDIDRRSSAENRPKTSSASTSKAAKLCFHFYG